MNNGTTGLTDSSLDQKRAELLALSRQLREEHSQLRTTYKILLLESRELKKESKLLRTNGHSPREGDEFTGLLAPLADG